MIDFSEHLAAGFDDELEKFAFFKGLRERIFGPSVEGDPEPIPDENKFRGALGRFSDFLGAFIKGETLKRQTQGMVVHPGTHDLEALYDALDATVEPARGGGIWTNVKPYGSTRYHSDERIVDLVAGQLGTAYHEGGHVVGLDNMPDALREPYLDVVEASSTYGPKLGLALLPNALLDPPGKRRMLSKWGPLAALAPSVPMLFEEARANVIGGRAAHSRGDIMPFLNAAVPSFASYAAEAASVPLGLYMIHRAKERQLAAAQKKALAAEVADHPMPKAAAAALGFADEIEKLGGLKTKLLLGSLLAAPFAPGIAKRTLMSGAQNFNEPGRPPRFGHGNVTSQRGNFPLIEKIRFNPIVTGVADTVRRGGDAWKTNDVGGTALDFWGGPKVGFGD